MPLGKCVKRRRVYATALQPKEVTCPNCGGPLRCAALEEVEAVIAGQKPPDVAAAA
jgi:hypothetical protein